jgi:hypothetical protein
MCLKIITSWPKRCKFPLDSTQYETTRYVPHGFKYRKHNKNILKNNRQQQDLWIARLEHMMPSNYYHSKKHIFYDSILKGDKIINCVTKKIEFLNIKIECKLLASNDS